MPSTRFEARNQAKAIPLVTVSLARGHLRQTRLASNIDRAGTAVQNQEHDQHHGQPPPYDTVNNSNDSSDSDSNNSGRELVTASPSNEDLTEAVLHLSRTLVSTAKAIPQPSPTSSWVFMMIYSWTHTQRTATRLYHILTKPSTFLKEIQEQNDQALVQQQQRRQQKSIQQLTEEQDLMEDDPDMINGATEMVPVSMMNTRSVAAMEESLPEDPEAPDAHGGEDSSDDDLTMPRKPKRQIDQYPNPFGPGISNADEMEDDEGWFGRGEERSEDGHTKTNSIRLISAKLAPNYSRRIPVFPTSSLGPAMDPRQFESGEGARTGSPASSFSTSSLFNTPRGSSASRPASSFSRTRYSTGEDESAFSSPTISTSSGTSFHTVDQSPPSTLHLSEDLRRKPRGLMTEQQGEFMDTGTVQDRFQSHHHNHMSEAGDLPWSEHLRVPEDYNESQSIASIPDLVFSPSATFADFASTVISTSTSAHSISSASSIRSLDQAIS